MKTQAIFVEAGHGLGASGQKDPGAGGKLNGVYISERECAVRIASKVFEIIKNKPEFSKILVQDVAIKTEANIIKKMKYVNEVITKNKFDPKYCFGVAIHMNSSTSKKATGFEVWHQRNGLSQAFARSIVDSWNKYNVTPLRPKPVNSSKDGRYGKFYIDDTFARYVIVETGFVSNPEEVKIVIENLDRVAEAIAHGMLEHIRSLK